MLFLLLVYCYMPFGSSLVKVFFKNDVIGNFDIQHYNVLINILGKTSLLVPIFFPIHHQWWEFKKKQILAYFCIYIDLVSSIWNLYFLNFLKECNWDIDPVFSYFFCTIHSSFLWVFFSLYHGNKIYKSINILFFRFPFFSKRFFLQIRGQTGQNFGPCTQTFIVWILSLILFSHIPENIWKFLRAFIK